MAQEVAAKNATADEKKFMERHKDNLSRSTLHAKWIHSPKEHEDHKGQTLATRDHDVIKHWAAARKAVPATVPGSRHGDRFGVLRFNFPGYGSDDLQEVSWDDWFKTFDDRHLVFLYQEHKSDGHESNFFHFDSPEREHG
jgi:hypothetical protein